MDESISYTTFFGCFAVLLAIIAWVGDYRRQRRKDIERVGFMPWTPIFFFSLMAAILLLGMSTRAWLGN